VGEAETVTGPAGGSLEIPLRAVLDARVTVEVVGPDDRALPSATVAWQGDQAHCLPADAPANGRGYFEMPVGAGTHMVVVTAPDHTVHQQSVTMAPGAHETLRIKLDTTLVVLEDDRILILEKVHFETAKAVIQPVSFPLLDQVATTMVQHPEILKLEVAGHTDSQGGDSYNMDLSIARAAAVQDYLARRDVERSRLSSAGYGESRPIDTNNTPKGREMNRRVEFNILDSEGGR
jgi:outer membrane protein OmpA-like peptidoglycan-associated protein